MRELTAADRERVAEQVAAMQRVNMWGPAKLATVHLLLLNLARHEPFWPIPDDPVWPMWEWPPAPCPPPGHVAVLPTLTPYQDWLLGRAAHAAVHGRWRLWDGQWREIAELDTSTGRWSGPASLVPAATIYDRFAEWRESDG